MKESGIGAGAAPRLGDNQDVTVSSERSLRRISVTRESASLLAISLLFFSWVVGLQWLSGAYQNEFGGDPDEAGHFVTGLMMRDYFTTAPLTPPMSFAQNYYLHYPKVALGHWPPLFYIVQTAWGLLFTSSRFSLLLLMALTTTLLAVTISRVIRNEYGTMAGIAMGTLIILLPMTQENTSLVMADMLSMLLSCWAMICFGHYLDAMRPRDAIGFGIFASLTILTKGNGLVLVLVPPVSLLLSRRFHLLARASFWYPAVIVLLVCGPWYILTRKMWQGITDTGLGLRDTIGAISFYSWQLIKIGGIGLSLLMAIGFAVRVVKPFREKAVGGKWAAAGAMLLSVWLFYCIQPSGNNNRYLLVAIPALLMFLAAGVAWAAPRLPLSKLTTPQKAQMLAVVAALAFAAETFAIPKRTNYGFAEAAQSIVSKPEFRNSLLLVAADAVGEGMFISEVAQREQRPGHIILRASKALAQSLWSGDRYQLSHRTPEEAMRYLDEIPVGIVVMGDWLYRSVLERRDHYHQLDEVLRSYPQHWELLGSYPRLLGETAGEIRVYRRIDHENKPVNQLRIRVNSKLNEAVGK